MAKRYSYEEVKDYFASQGCVLISTDYKNNKTRLEYMCSCGNTQPSFTTFSTFKSNGSRCAKCGRERTSEARRHTLDDIQQIFESYGCRLTSTEYKNRNQKLDFICKCSRTDSKSLNSFLRTGKCKVCNKEISVRKRRLPIEKVQETFAEKGCVLLTKKYYRNTQKLKFICSCGGVGNETYTDFTGKGLRCNECKKKKTYSYEEVKKYFESHGCELLEPEYKTVDTPMSYRCECGSDEYNVTFYSFKNGQRCRKCFSRNLGDRSRKYSLLDVANHFSEEGCVLLETSYSNGKTPLKYICTCGDESTISYEKFRLGQRCRKCANKKFGESQRGEANHNWNPDKTDDERLLERSSSDYKYWRKSVYERDNFTCVCCGSKSKRSNPIQAHHLDGHNWCRERRTDVSNGVTLCLECHTEFHITYGYGNNTEEQYNEWIRMRNKQEKDAI